MKETIERIKRIMEWKKLSKEDLCEKTGLKYTRIGNIFSGRAQIRLEDIKLIGEAYPEYKLWLAYGETIPESGQTSPEIEETQESYKKTGGD